LPGPPFEWQNGKTCYIAYSGQNGCSGTQSAPSGTGKHLAPSGTQQRPSNEPARR
jgi:hypothetical protein